MKLSIEITPVELVELAEIMADEFDIDEDDYCDCECDCMECEDEDDAHELIQSLVDIFTEMVEDE